MKDKHIIEALDRAQYLLDAAMRFILVNRLGEYSVHYDDADCDGLCLYDDCETARDAARICLSFYKERT